MRQPNEYWLRYLLYKDMTFKQVKDSSVSHGFPEPSDEYLSFLSDIVKKDVNNPIEEGLHLADIGILPMVRGEPVAVQAKNIFDEPRVRECLETLLVSGMATVDAVEYTETITGRPLPEDVVDTFKYYYWNTNLVTTTDLKKYLALYKDRGAMLIQAFASGPEYALWKLGYRVELTKDDILSGLLHEGSMRFLETSGMKNTKETAMTAKMWSEIVFKALDEKAKSGDEVKEVIQHLKNIAIKLDEDGIPDAERLTGGSHSNNKDNKKSK